MDDKELLDEYRIMLTKLAESLNKNGMESSAKKLIEFVEVVESKRSE